MAEIGIYGTGPGELAPDGSAVEHYATLPPDESTAALLHAAIRPGGSVLDLGAGAGRVTHPLIALGHPVVAVDESAAMLAHIRGAQTVRSAIEELDLGRTFDCVLLMSFLIEYGSDRRALLDTCRRHVAPTGHVVLQRLPPAYYRTVGAAEWTRDGMHVRMYDVERHGDGMFSATMEYRVGDRAWTHSFTSRQLGDDELPGVLAASGLRLDRFLDETGGWIAARPV